MALSPIWIDDWLPLPPTRLALGPQSEAPGLLAAGGGITTARLNEAYRRGIFPWFSDNQPVLWWTPDPRMVLKTADFHLPHTLGKTLRRFLRTPGCSIRVDTAFDAVIGHCAGAVRNGQSGTWILPSMVEAYRAWHRLGAVHSIETWVDDELVGGLYGVCIGRMFFGESMFARRPDASKLALAALICLCLHHGIGWIDCQQQTAHLARFGAKPVPRAAFEQHLAVATQALPIADWTYDPAWWSHLWADHADPIAASGLQASNRPSDSPTVPT